MRVFVTGATGMIGSAVVRELLAEGHQVSGLTRSDASAQALADAGGEPVRGTLTDLDVLRAAAENADGVVHTAFQHDLGDMVAAARTDLAVIEAIGDVLAGSDRPFVFTSGTAGVAPGRTAAEDTPPPPSEQALPRVVTEGIALAYAARGVRVSSVRLPPSVHGSADKHGFIPTIIATARDKGVSSYVDSGANRWPAVHQLDAAHLFRLALEHAPAGSVLHGVGDEGVPTKELAEVIGRQLGVPVRSVAAADAAAHFGFLGLAWGLDMPATSVLTQKLLDWHPVQPGLVADLEAGHYFEVR